MLIIKLFYDMDAFIRVSLRFFAKVFVLISRVWGILPDKTETRIQNLHVIRAF